MKYNFFYLIINVCNENNINADLKFIGDIDKKINELLERGTNESWICNNLECLI